MMKPEEAINAMDANIRALGENQHNVGFLVSLDIAQPLFDFINTHRGPGSAPEIAEPGQTFMWRNVSCIVAE